MSTGMNPSVINTTNVQQFGFVSSFLLETSTLTFNIASLTIFKPGGAANIAGICFQVIDPSGSHLADIDWNDPSIDTAAGETTFVVNLSGYPAMFGYYKIKGVLREQNGMDYPIEFSVNICKPVGFKNGTVAADMQEIVDCTVPKVGVTDVTNYSYLNKSPISQIKDGMFYYPQGTLDPIPFSYTPFEVYGNGLVYTGNYTVRAKIISSYDIGNQVLVQVTNIANFTFNVDCNSNLCSVMCCMEDLQSIAETQCNTPVGINAQKKLEKAILPFMMALTQEKCGKDSSQLVKEVMDILGCDCNCDGQSVEPSPIYSAFTPTVLTGFCGTTAVYNSVQGIWEIKSRTVSVINAPGSSTAISISSTTTDCNVAWNVTLDEDILTGNILNTISDNDIYLALFNSLVQQSGVDLSVLGNNCIINTASCNYSLTINVTNPGILVINVMINGTVFTAPALLASNAAGISSWLNTLNLGVFTASYDSVTFKTVINSNANPNIIGTMTLSLNGVQQVQQFSKSCASVVAVLKAIIDYLCGITEDQILLGQSYLICSVKADGSPDNTTIAANGYNTVATLLTAITTSFCSVLSFLMSKGTVSCSEIKSVFADKTSTVNTTLDVLYGTRGTTTTTPGNCGALTYEDLARTLFTFMTQTNQQDIIDLFCQTKDRCFTPVCNAVTAATIELIQPCPGIAAITGAFTT